MRSFFALCLLLLVRTASAQTTNPSLSPSSDLQLRIHYAGSGEVDYTLRNSSDHNLEVGKFTCSRHWQWAITGSDVALVSPNYTCKKNVCDGVAIAPGATANGVVRITNLGASTGTVKLRLGFRSCDPYYSDPPTAEPLPDIWSDEIEVDRAQIPTDPSLSQDRLNIYFSIPRADR
ncbi:MAG: hypothetical protein U0136_06665 [Bdellovibrionota bacterium]